MFLWKEGKKTCSDVLVITREYSGKQIFKTFIPLDKLIVWDVPAKFGMLI
jgi:hypothetical protein